MSFKHAVARKNPKSRYKTGAERTLAQLMLEILLRLNFISPQLKIIPQNIKVAV